MKFVADDGKVFDNAQACKAYEASKSGKEAEKKAMEKAINEKLGEVSDMIDAYFKRFPEELAECKERDAQRGIPVPVLMSMLFGE